MSDSMERNKNDSLAAREMEQEEEEMKRELLDMGMYESGYTYKEMKDILGFISESKNMANMANDNKNVQKDVLHSTNDSITDGIRKTNLIQDLEIQEHSNPSRSIHSYRANHTSPVLEHTSTHDASSPETMPVYESRSSTHRRKSSDGDEIFDRIHDSPSVRDSCPNNTNRYASLRSRNSLHEAHNAHTGELKMDTQSGQSQKLDRWRINPLDCCTNENDVPLRQSDRPSAEDREPFRFCKDAQSPEVFSKVLLSLNRHLKEMAELWHSWHQTTDSKFQWGSPIQVGTANDSLDRNPISSPRSESNRLECMSKYMQERPYKRKCLSTAFTSILSSSEDEDDLFISLKRTKTQLDEKQSRVSLSSKELRGNRNEINSPTPKSRDELLDTDNTSTSSKKLQPVEKRGSKRELPSTKTSPKYPRRIVPPNPTKRNQELKEKKSRNLEDQKERLPNRKDVTQSTDRAILQRKNLSLEHDDILMELENESSEESTDLTNKAEVKPLPIKSLSARLEKGYAMLKKYQMQEQLKQEAEKEEVRRKEEEQKKKIEDSIKKRVEDMQKKYREKQEAEKLEREKSMKWNSVLQMKSKEIKEKVMSVRDNNDVSRCEVAQDIRSNTEQDTNDSEECVNCPICNKPFPTARIEAHAAECEQYNNEGNGDDVTFVNVAQSAPSSSRRYVTDISVFECNVCSKFKTSNGIDYEDHVNSCLQRKQNREQPASFGSPIEIHDVPTSPIKCFRPISAQTDSEIDYKRQFKSDGKSQSHRGRKRKR